MSNDDLIASRSFSPWSDRLTLVIVHVCFVTSVAFPIFIGDHINVVV